MTKSKTLYFVRFYLAVTILYQCLESRKTNFIALKVWCKGSSVSVVTDLQWPLHYRTLTVLIFDGGCSCWLMLDRWKPAASCCISHCIVIYTHRYVCILLAGACCVIHRQVVCFHKILLWNVTSEPLAGVWLLYLAQGDQLTKLSLWSVQSFCAI